MSGGPRLSGSLTADGFASLKELTPRYLPEIPSAAAFAYRDRLWYSRTDARAGSGGYELGIGMHFGMSFDQFVYWPSEAYPDRMSPGNAVRVGKWAYVHD